MLVTDRDQCENSDQQECGEGLEDLRKRTGYEEESLLGGGLERSEALL